MTEAAKTINPASDDAGAQERRELEAKIAIKGFGIKWKAIFTHTRALLAGRTLIPPFIGGAEIYEEVSEEVALSEHWDSLLPRFTEDAHASWQTERLIEAMLPALSAIHDVTLWAVEVDPQGNWTAGLKKQDHDDGLVFIDYMSGSAPNRFEAVARAAAAIFDICVEPTLNVRVTGITYDEGRVFRAEIVSSYPS